MALSSIEVALWVMKRTGRAGTSGRSKFKHEIEVDSPFLEISIT
jgi:hypothetical protein